MFKNNIQAYSFKNQAKILIQDQLIKINKQAWMSLNEPI